MTIAMIKQLLKSMSSMINLIERIEGRNMVECYIDLIIPIF